MWYQAGELLGLGMEEMTTVNTMKLIRKYETLFSRQISFNKMTMMPVTCPATMAVVVVIMMVVMEMVVLVVLMVGILQDQLRVWKYGNMERGWGW